jgi:hypothetical protein
VQAQFFSNAFSNTNDYVRLRPNENLVECQFSMRLRRRANLSELERAHGDRFDEGAKVLVLDRTQPSLPMRKIQGVTMPMTTSVMAPRIFARR